MAEIIVNITPQGVLSNPRGPGDKKIINIVINANGQLVIITED